MTGDAGGYARGDADRDVRGAETRPPLPSADAAAPGGAPRALDGELNPSPVTFMQYVDGAWLRWSVAEVDARAVPGAHGARCLVFTRQDCIRRVWDYPVDWRALDDTGLAALSWHR